MCVVGWKETLGKTWARIRLQEVYGEVLLGTSLEVSEGIRIGQREKLNFDALGPIPRTALVLDGPAVIPN